MRKIIIYLSVISFLLCTLVDISYAAKQRTDKQKSEEKIFLSTATKNYHNIVYKCLELNDDIQNDSSTEKISQSIEALRSALKSFERNTSLPNTTKERRKLCADIYDDLYKTLDNKFIFLESAEKYNENKVINKEKMEELYRNTNKVDPELGKRLNDNLIVFFEFHKIIDTNSKRKQEPKLN